MIPLWKLMWCHYAFHVWHILNAHIVVCLQKNIHTTTRFVKNTYQQTESVSAMLQDLQWPSLQSRREAAIKTMLFKISHNLITINKDQYLTPPPPDRYQAEKLPSSKISAPHYSLHQGHLQVFIYANCGQTLEHPSCRHHHSSISGRLQGTHLYQLAPGESFLLALVYSSTTVFLLHMHP